MTQTKITSAYNNKASKLDSVSRMIDQKDQNCQSKISQQRIDVDDESTNNIISLKNKDGHLYLQIDDEEKPYGMTLKSKRRHSEFTSPICENAKSPSINQEVNLDTSCHGFVTARKKLVSVQ